MAIPVSLELFSVRNSLAADLIGTLKKVKSFGYDCVEFAGGPVHTAIEYANALKEADLWCSGWHYPYEPLFDEGKLFDDAVKFHLEAGNKYIIMPWMPDTMLNSYDSLQKTAEKVNLISEKLKKYGLYTGYHNHSAEFSIIPETNKTIWSTLRDLTSPDFIMQLDTGNAMHGGADIKSELYNSPGRAQILHLKPYSYKNGYETILGDLGDDNDYSEILNFCREKGGTVVYVIEYECETLYNDLDGVKICIDNLKNKYGNLL